MNIIFLMEEVMITSKLLKVSKLVVIVLLIAGIISCGGAEEIAGSRGGDVNVIEVPDGTEQTDEPTFAEDTYYSIYAPFVDWEDKSEVPGENKITVSWQDTNTLTQIWKKQIEGGKDNDGERWFIRDADNRQKEPLTGSFYYFDKDFNIVYFRQGKGSLLVRKLISGIMIGYTRYKGRKPPENWVIGAVYETVLTKNEITENNLSQLNMFMGDGDMGEDSGNLEILTMNTGYSFNNDSEFGVDFYYNKGVKNIEEYTSENTIKIRGVRNLSWKPDYVNFKFFSATPYEWHLTEHSGKQGWH